MFQKAISRLDQVRDTLYGRPYLVLLSIGLAAVLVYLAAIPLPRVDGQLVGGDGIRYWSAWRICWQAAAFGGRIFMSGVAIFVLGLTALVDWFSERRDSILIELAALAFIAWNALFMIQYRFGFVSLWDPLTFRELVLDKFTLPIRLFQRLLK